jgi:serine/threonine protein kinase
MWRETGSYLGRGAFGAVYTVEPDTDSKEWESRPRALQRVHELGDDGERKFAKKHFDPPTKRRHRDAMANEFRVAREALVKTEDQDPPENAVEVVDWCAGEGRKWYIVMRLHTSFSNRADQDQEFWDRLWKGTVCVATPGAEGLFGDRPIMDASKAGALTMHRALLLLKLSRDWANGIKEVCVRANSKAHRDLKPENALVALMPAPGGRDGVAFHEVVGRVSDFGEVRDIDGNGTLTGDGRGSRLYMSPQQLERAADADERDDVWSMGVLLVHSWLQAEVATDEERDAAAMFRIEDVETIQELRELLGPQQRDADLHRAKLAGLPRPLAAVAAVCLHPDRDRRPTLTQYRDLVDELIGARELEGRPVADEVVDDGDLAFDRLPADCADGAAAAQWALGQAMWSPTGPRTVLEHVAVQDLLIDAAQLLGARPDPNATFHEDDPTPDLEAIATHPGLAMLGVDPDVFTDPPA